MLCMNNVAGGGGDATKADFCSTASALLAATMRYCSRAKSRPLAITASICSMLLGTAQIADRVPCIHPSYAAADPAQKTIRKPKADFMH